MTKRETLDALVFILPMSIVWTFTICLKWHSRLGDWPDVYGMFYPISSDSIGSSLHYEYYIKGIIINILLFSIISALVYFALVKRILNSKIKRIIIRLILVAFWGVMLLKAVFVGESDMMWDYDKTSKFEKKTLYIGIK